MNLDKKFRSEIPKPKFGKPYSFDNNGDPNEIDDKVIEDEDLNDIENPFENRDDLLIITSSNDLTKEEENDLQNFNIGIYLEQFRSNINNNFQVQDFSDFVDLKVPAICCR